MGPMSLHHDKVKQLAAASHGARSSQAAGCDSCVGAVPEGGPALLLGELSAQLTERLIDDLPPTNCSISLRNSHKRAAQPQLSVPATVLRLPLVGT